MAKYYNWEKHYNWKNIKLEKLKLEKNIKLQKKPLN